jgi:hypothetical protein
VADEKRCKVCGEVKPLTEFYRMPGMRDGHRNDCKACNLAGKHARYVANPEPTKERVKAWQAANMDRHLENQRRRRARPDVKAKNRADHLRRKYGITQADYEALLARQNGGCAICRRKPNEKISLHVDHEHDSGRIRGLLCFRCNNALGDLGDDPVQLQRAIAYLSPPRDEDLRIAALIRERLRQELLRQ